MWTLTEVEMEAISKVAERGAIITLLLPVLGIIVIMLCIRQIIKWWKNL